jgi:hypothetical protein
MNKVKSFGFLRFSVRIHGGCRWFHGQLMELSVHGNLPRHFLFKYITMDRYLKGLTVVGGLPWQNCHGKLLLLG